MAENTAADDKNLALQYALTALIETLTETNVIERADLLRNLTACRTRLENIGEVSAAKQLSVLSEALLRS
jgi:hypothetical protein